MKDLSLRVDSSIRQLEERVDEAQKELCRTLQKTFPPDTRISWIVQRGGNHYEQLGTVISVSTNWWSEPSMWACNDSTGNMVRVTLSMFPRVRKFIPKVDDAKD